MIPEQRSTAELDLDELRARRTLLMDELQGVKYWRLVARAQSDLLIASLLYSGHADLDGLHDMAAPHGAAGRQPGAGERLVRLREREQLMRHQQQALRDDLDEVTRELVDRVVPRQAAVRRQAMGTLPTG